MMPSNLSSPPPESAAPPGFPPPAYHPVLHLKAPWRVYDFSRFEDQQACLSAGAAHGVGRYLERRQGLYPQTLFREGAVQRDIHMGIDLFAAAGTPVFAFADGRIAWTGYRDQPGDYGFVLVTEHVLPMPSAFGAETGAGLHLFALYGHLSRRDHACWSRGLPFRSGDRLGWLGKSHENGGWIPHLHFQLSFLDPGRPDMPGAVTDAQVAQAALVFPDPRLILGPLY